MIKRLDIGIDTVKKVIHLADIHIRNVRRHKEFRVVFENLYKQLDAIDLTDTIIYLGGDIAHSKTDMSPELIREITTLLTELCSRAPVFLILGNHDCSLNNSTRLDVLTPLVDSLNLPNLYYMRDSGTYVVGDTSFTTFSILDDPSVYPTLLENVPDDVRTKIVFFHGPVHQSITDVGYVINNRSITPHTFSGYDIAMLGDIHKHQTLQQRTEDELEIDEAELDSYLKRGWEIWQKSKSEK